MSETANVKALSEMEREEMVEAINANNPALTSLSATEMPLQVVFTSEWFQPRDDWNDWEQEAHVKGLAASIKATKKLTPLEPLTVTPVLGGYVLLDGHLRLRAYEAAGWEADRPIPVSVLVAPFSECLKFSIEANSRDKLPMTPAQKQEAAWRLLTYSMQVTTNPNKPLYSQREIGKCAGVCLGTVNKQSQLLRKLAEVHGDEAMNMTHREALTSERGDAEQMEPDELFDKRAKEWTNRLGKTFGKQPTKSPDVFAEALRNYSPRLYARLFEVMVNDDPELARGYLEVADNIDF